MAYLPTKLGSFGGFHVGKYTIQNEHLGFRVFQKLVLLGGLKYVLIFTPKMGEDEPISTHIFSNGVETTK